MSIPKVYCDDLRKSVYENLEEAIGALDFTGIEAAQDRGIEGLSWQMLHRIIREQAKRAAHAVEHLHAIRSFYEVL